MKEVFYTYEETTKTKEIKLHQDIYLQFQKELKLDDNFFIIFNGELVKKGTKFESFQNQIEKLGFIIHPIEIAIKHFFQAQEKGNQLKISIDILKQENEELKQNQLQNEKIIKQLEQKIIELQRKINEIPQYEWIYGKCDSSQADTQLYQNDSSMPENLVVSQFMVEKQQNQLLSSLIKKKEEELNILKQIEKSSIFSTVDQQSIMQSIIFNCFFCNLEINQESCQTDCSHSYHKDCFDVMVQAEIHSKQTILQCICKQKLSFKCMEQFLNSKRQFIFYYDQFLMNQIGKIRTDNQNIVKSCKNKSCFFFIFIKEETKMMIQSFCPLCLSYDVY